MTGNDYGLRIEIRVKGHVDRDWSDWLENLTVHHSKDGDTLLSGMVPDQAALYGLLNRLSRLGLQLISVSSRGMNPRSQGGVYEG